ncbi:MAG: YbhB/YbcL family Raf kinase inhibitor-like protein [candidate division Zixibacteria bacterium]|nr:YbhB/YbcL family Raf kinase inhibitor-like protein [candidate division Zixibacteria bacterium]
MFKVISKILILLFIFSISAFGGDTGAIKGRVNDVNTGEILRFAFIRITGTSFGSMVNDSGYYYIDSIPLGTYEVLVEGRNHLPQNYTDIEVVKDSTIELYSELRHVPVFLRHRPSLGNKRKELVPDDEPYLKSSIMNNGRIHEKHTCDGENISPPFWIKNLPDETKSLVLICDTVTNTLRKFVHWIVLNIPPDIGKLPEAIGKSKYPSINQKSNKMILTQGVNDSGEIGYNGPCIQSGMAQTYFFRMYALDKILRFSRYKIRSGISFDELSKEMDGHILAETVLFGRYWKE